MSFHNGKVACILLLAWTLGLPTSRAEEKSPVGTKAPEWEVTNWMNSDALKLGDLKGKVVLVRWWFGPGCPFCKATAPALNEFHSRNKDQGLVVIGFYHHKANTPLSPARVQRTAKDYQFEFPIAIDEAKDSGWRTLNRWWLNDDKRRWTSVSFLIDRQGVIRHVHPGGQYVKGDKAYEAMKAKIEELVKEN